MLNKLVLLSICYSVILLKSCEAIAKLIYLDDRKKLIILFLFFSVLFPSCIQRRSYEHLKGQFDEKMVILDTFGYQMQMTTGLAKLVTEDKGYKINPRFSSSTFDEVTPKENAYINVYGNYSKDFDINIKLDFESGKLSQIECSFQSKTNFDRDMSIPYEEYQRKKFEKLLHDLVKLFSNQVPLELSENKEFLTEYAYRPNKRAWVRICLFKYGKGDNPTFYRLTMNVYDSNYRARSTYLKIQQIYAN